MTDRGTGIPDVVDELEYRSDDPYAAVSKVRVERRGADDIVLVWSDTVFAGFLTVKAGEGTKLADRLLPLIERWP